MTPRRKRVRGANFPLLIGHQNHNVFSTTSVPSKTDMTTLHRDPRDLEGGESGTAPGSPLGEAFAWLHSAERTDGGVTNPLFGWLSKSYTSATSKSASPAPAAAASAAGDEPSFFYKRAAPPRNPAEYTGRLSSMAAGCKCRLGSATVWC